LKSIGATGGTRGAWYINLASRRSRAARALPTA